MRAAGAVPATIAVLDGEPHVGLDEDGLARIATDRHGQAQRPRPAAGRRARRRRRHHGGRHRPPRRAGGDPRLRHRRAGRRAPRRARVVGRVGRPARARRARRSRSWPPGSSRSSTSAPRSSAWRRSASRVAGWRTDRFPGFYLTDGGFDLDWSVRGRRRGRRGDGGGRRAGRRGRARRGQPGRRRPSSSTRPSTSASWPRGSSARAAAGVTGKAVTPFLLDHLHRATDGPLAGGQHRGRARQRVGGGRHRGGMGGARVILVVGDVMDDLVVRPLGPLVPRSDTPAHMERHPGGSGANTAAWLGVARRRRCASPAASASPTCAATRGRSRPAASTRAWPATRARRPAASSSSPTTARCSPTAGPTSPSGATTCPTTCSTASTHVHVSGYSLLEEGPRGRGPRPRRARRRALVGRSRVARRSWPTRRSWSGPRGRASASPTRTRRRCWATASPTPTRSSCSSAGARACASLRRGRRAVDVPAATGRRRRPDRRGRRLRRRLPRGARAGEDDRRVRAGGGPRGDRGGQPPRAPGRG